MKRALIFLLGLILANSAGSAPTSEELVRVWKSPGASVQERADAVNRRFTNGTPILGIVAILGTNYICFRPFSAVWIGPGPAPRKTCSLIYNFGQESVLVHTSADLNADPLTGKLLGVGFRTPAGAGYSTLPVYAANGEAAAAPPLGASTDKQTYSIRAGGPRNFVGLTNLPASNRVAISPATRTASNDDPVFWLTNRELHSILLWNVRVQTRSAGRGTDGFGWDTVADDYPTGTDKYNSALYPTNSIGQFRVVHPGTAPWRVCVLYSIDWSDSGKSYGGNYEVISEELKE